MKNEDWLQQSAEVPPPGTGLRGFLAPVEPLRLHRRVQRTPVDLGQKYLNCLFVKLHGGNIYNFNIKNDQISFSFLNAYNL